VRDDVEEEDAGEEGRMLVPDGDDDDDDDDGCCSLRQTTDTMLRPPLANHACHSTSSQQQGGRLGTKWNGTVREGYSGGLQRPSWGEIIKCIVVVIRVIITTRFQSEDQVCISTTLR
jgi:hypothetical protein